MSFHHLDQYAHRESAVTRLSPVVRLLCAVTIAVGVALLPLGAWPQMGLFGTAVLVATAVAGVPFTTLARRMLGPLAFVFAASALLLVVVPGEPVVALGWLEVTDAGLLRFGSGMGRGAVALAAAVLLVSTTRFSDLVHALRQLRLPRAVTSALGLAYRFVYILVDELERMRRAARARNAGSGAATKRAVLVGITSALLARTFDRGERTYSAMLARGYRGDMPMLTERPLDATGVLVVATTLVVAAAITISSYTVLPR
jgi:cobalt/nickel transport system permease protein